jgi:electron transfer flavoprotein beta subunit
MPFNNGVAKDAFFVATQIAAYAKKKPSFDMILTGRESIDYNGAKVAFHVWRIIRHSICF